MLIRCKGACIPDEVKEDTWNDFSLKYKIANYDWTKVCFKLSQIESIQEITDHPDYCNVRFKSGEGFTVNISYAKMDKMLVDKR